MRTAAALRSGTIPIRRLASAASDFVLSWTFSPLEAFPDGMVLMSTKQEIAFPGHAMLFRASNGLNPLFFYPFTLLEFLYVLRVCFAKRD